MLFDMLLDCRHQVIAVFISDICPPAEVVQTIVAYGKFFARFHSKNFRHAMFDTYRHVANVDDFAVRTQFARRFGYNRCRIGVVQHPCVRRILLHVIHQLQHASNRTHAVCNPAWPTSFLADDTVFQRNFFIFFTHRIFSDADMGHHEIDIRKGSFRISGRNKSDFRRTFFQDNFARIRDLLLSLRVIVIEFDLSDRKNLQIFQ